VKELTATDVAKGSLSVNNALSLALSHDRISCTGLAYFKEYCVGIGYGTEQRLQEQGVRGTI
jgi:hypothetical protein